jgi:hypothetical protein
VPDALCFVSPVSISAYCNTFPALSVLEWRSSRRSSPASPREFPVTRLDSRECGSRHTCCAAVRQSARGIAKTFRQTRLARQFGSPELRKMTADTEKAQKGNARCSALP